MRTLLRVLPLVLLALMLETIATVDRLNGASLPLARLAPTVFLGFGLLALVAPLAVGGGQELFPSLQLIAYPVSADTQFLAGLLLAPLNLVWVLQLLSVVAETANLTHRGHRGAGAVIAVAFVVAATACGQTLAWLVAGIRVSRRGRHILAAAACAWALLVLLALLPLSRPGPPNALLGRALVRAITSGPTPLWATTIGILFLITTVALLAGRSACRWALGRSGPRRAAGPRSVRRRRARRTPLGALIAVDRTSVWRAPALRLSGITFTVLSTSLAVVAAIPVGFVVVLPALVATSAGLLFGINAFSLDGSGALWLSSLPHHPRLTVLSKLSVLAATVLGAMLLTGLMASLRTANQASLSELIALLMSVLASGALVVATCLALSVGRPHRADLNGPRDVIAPPAALAAASARLAFPVSFVGVLLQGASGSGVWWLPILIALPVLGSCALWLRRSIRAYAFDAARRARIVHAISSG